MTLSVAVRHVPAALVIAGFCYDLNQYFGGLSWTYAHYESLLPLLAYLLERTKARLFVSVLIALIVHFLSVIYFEFGLGYWKAIEGGYLQALVGFGLCGIVFGVILGRLKARRLPLIALVFAFALVVDKAVSSDRALSAWSRHFVTTPRGTLGISWNSGQQDSPVYRFLIDQMRRSDGVVLVIVESLGVKPNSADLIALKDKFKGLEFRYERYDGGATVDAEVRYLCGSVGFAEGGRGCLPSGQESWAFHGNTLNYFDRYSLYRELGFKRIFGRGELSSLDRCSFAYNATCDKALIGKLVSTVKQSSCHGFYYLLTIDSHFPYRKYQIGAEGVYADLDALLTTLADLREMLPKCEFLVVGDHPPPLSRDFRRDVVLLIRPRRETGF